MASKFISRSKTDGTSILDAEIPVELYYHLDGKYSDFEV
jgi:hypothetical protein